MLDAQFHVALIIDTAGVRKLVSLEPDQGRGLWGAVLELAHDLVVHGTSLRVDELLVAPTETISNWAACDMHSIDILQVESIKISVL